MIWDETVEVASMPEVPVVTVRTIYQVDCQTCHAGVWPDEVITDMRRALEVRQEHLDEHARGDW